VCTARCKPADSRLLLVYLAFFGAFSFLFLQGSAYAADVGRFATRALGIIYLSIFERSVFFSVLYLLFFALSIV